MRNKPTMKTVFDRMRKGQIEGRMVLDLGN